MTHSQAAPGLPSDYTVPPITEPLDPSRFAADPCTLLTPEQRVEFGLSDTEQNELAGTVECLLHPPGDAVTTVQIQLMTGVADQAVLLVNDVAQPECQRATEIATAGLTTLREES